MGCLYAKYTDNSAESNKICFKYKNHVNPNDQKLTIVWHGTGCEDFYATVNLTATSGSGSNQSFTFGRVGTSSSGNASFDMFPGNYSVSVSDARVKNPGADYYTEPTSVTVDPTNLSGNGNKSITVNTKCEKAKDTSCDLTYSCSNVTTDRDNPNNRGLTINYDLQCTSGTAMPSDKIKFDVKGVTPPVAITSTETGIGGGIGKENDKRNQKIPLSFWTAVTQGGFTVTASTSSKNVKIVSSPATCDGDGGSTQCVSASNNTTVSLDKSPTASNAITIWPSVYLSKALDKYVEFELACDFKNLDNGYTETYYATVGIDAGRTSPSSTGAALRGKAGTCYEQLTPCTVKQIKPSTANICKPISETTSKAQTPSGCSSSSTCSITLVGSGDTSSDTSASVNLTGGSTLSTKLDYGNNFRTSWTNLKCGVAYNIKASDCKAGSNTCTVEASPSTISKLTGTQTVTVKFKKAASSKTYNITMCWKDEAGVAHKYGNTDATATYCGASGSYSNPDGSSGNFSDSPYNCQKATVKEGGTISWSQNSSCTGAPEGGFSTCVPKGFRLEGKAFSGSTTVQGYSYTNLSGNVLWDCSGSSKPKPTYTIRVWPRDEATTDSSNPLFVPCAAANVSNGPLERDVCFQIVGTLTCDSGSGSETKSGMKICFKEGFNSCSSSSGGSGSIGFSNVCAGKKTVSFSYKMVE
ncbi:hypothetical protein KID03_09525 [bacterium]|nr:hypothetical protein [bacterium]